MSKSIEHQRYENAEQAYMNFDFTVTIESQNGWTVLGDEFSRTIFFENDELDESNNNMSQPTLVGTVILNFTPGTAEIADMYAHDMHGNSIGEYSNPSQEEEKEVNKKPEPSI